MTQKKMRVNADWRIDYFADERNVGQLWEKPMIRRAFFYYGSVQIDFRGERVEVEYDASHGDVEEWWFQRPELRTLDLTLDEEEEIAEAVWEDAQL